MNPALDSRVFGIGLVGTGIMGRRMIAALADHPRFRVATLWDPDHAALRAAHALAPQARIADDPADVARDPAVTLVYVASPPATHRAAVQAAADAGRACLCEKPLAADVDDAMRLRDLVVASGLPFAMHFPFATSDAASRLASLVGNGTLGAIERASIHARFARWPRAWQAGAASWLDGPTEGGFTREVLSHFVFLALRLFGPATVEAVCTTREPGRAETALTARLVHRDIVVPIDAAVGGEVADHNRFEIVGSHASAALVDWSRLTWQGTTSARVDGIARTLTALAAFLDGRADHGLATIDEGLAVARCIEAMQGSRR